MNDLKRILVQLPTWVGDVVMAAPLCRSIRRQLPDVHLAAYGRKHLFELLEGGGWLQQTIPLQKKGSLLSVWREARRLRQCDFDATLILPNSFRSALTAFLAGIPVRVGHASDARGRLLTHRLPIATEADGFRSLPMVEYYAEMLPSLGLEGGDRQLEMGATPAQEREAAARFEALGLSGRVVAINPGTAFGPSKLWPTTYSARFADHFVRQGWQCALLCGPGEEPLARAIEAEMQEPATVVEPPLSLGGLYPFLGRCRFLLTTDSGVRHIGVAAGIPVLVVVGPTLPRYTDVPNENYSVILERPECWPCHLKTCPIDHRCMVDLTPEKVIARAEAMLSG